MDATAMDVISINPATLGQAPVRTTVAVVVVGAGVLGLAGLGYYLWRRRKQEEEKQARVQAFVAQIFQARTNEERQAAMVAAGGAVARGEFSTRDMQRLVGQSLANTIGNMAGSILGSVRMSNLRSQFIEEARAQRNRETMAGVPYREPFSFALEEEPRFDFEEEPLFG